MTTQINIDTKSQLAKLIATENIQVQHNKVQTASFDTLNRILTLPVSFTTAAMADACAEPLSAVTLIVKNLLVNVI